jgi:diguanylate cyclase (GGDEF)-like protein
MRKTYNFLKSILETIPEQVVVLSHTGDILFVNASWNSFGQNNACRLDGNWEGVNYLAECDKAATTGDPFGTHAAIGIRSVIAATLDEFYLEYPCHSPVEERWFLMRVTPISLRGDRCVVISHLNITERKIAEERVLALSRIDGLTNIPNRRYFDEFFNQEWNRCQRLGQPISLAIIDLDHFKLLNDTYGHPTGDECLKTMGKLLARFCNRPSDLHARFGGEEFAIVYGNTSLAQARVMIEKMFAAIGSLNIPNSQSPTLATLTASVGLTSMVPSQANRESDLVDKCDALLYRAKANGRNQIKSG